MNQNNLNGKTIFLKENGKPGKVLQTMESEHTTLLIQIEGGSESVVVNIEDVVVFGGVQK